MQMRKKHGIRKTVRGANRLLHLYQFSPRNQSTGVGWSMGKREELFIANFPASLLQFILQPRGHIGFSRARTRRHQRRITVKIASIALMLTLFAGTAAHAGLKVVGNGETLAIDTTEFPPQMQKAYGVMAKRCSQCHTIERVIVAVRSGITPLSRSSFTKDSTKALVTRMLLKAGPSFDKNERRTIVLLLNYLLDQTKVAEK